MGTVVTSFYIHFYNYFVANIGMGRKITEQIVRFKFVNINAIKKLYPKKL